jgi:hypothetical protein
MVVELAGFGLSWPVLVDRLPLKLLGENEPLVCIPRLKVICTGTTTLKISPSIKSYVHER